MCRALVLVAWVVMAGACSAKPSVKEPGGGPEPVQVWAMGEMNAMPSLAAMGDRVVLVWTGTKEGVMSVYSAVSEDRGATFNVQRRVNDQTGDVSTNVEQPPRVALSSSGLTVIWSSKRSGNASIRMARSGDMGRSFGAATTIHDASLSGARGWESVAAGADGSVHVVWLDGRNATHHASTAAHAPMRQDVFEATIDQRGTVTEAPVADNVCFCCKTAVAIGSRGQVFAAWRHIFPGSLRDIAMAASTDAGRTFGPLARVSEDKWEIDGCPEDGPSIAADATGDTHIAWPTVVDEGHPQKAIFYASTKDARTFASRVRLSRADQEEASHPQIAVGSSGTVAAVWDEPNGNERVIILRTREAGGQWSPSRRLNATATGSHPVVAPVADGFIVGWTNGTGTTSSIALQRIGVAPMPVKPVEKKAYTFRGRVESVDLAAGTLTVNSENVDGWMGAMTMVYGVDNKDIIATVKAGDQITATVYGGDFQTLHAVAITPRSAP